MSDSTREHELELLADVTAMLTLALHGDEDGLDRYVGGIHDVGRLRSLLSTGMLLYGQAFLRLGAEEGFDPVLVTQRIALDEARQRYGVASD